MPANGDDGHISYTTKEILTRIEGKLDMLSTQVSTKADISQVLMLGERVSRLETTGSPGAQDALKRLSDIERDPAWVTRQNTRERFFKLEEELRSLRGSSVTEDALRRYKRWLLVTAVPAALGAAWAVIRIVELYVTGGIR